MGDLSDLIFRVDGKTCSLRHGSSVRQHIQAAPTAAVAIGTRECGNRASSLASMGELPRNPMPRPRTASVSIVPPYFIV